MTPLGNRTQVVSGIALLPRGAGGEQPARLVRASAPEPESGPPHRRLIKALGVDPAVNPRDRTPWSTRTADIRTRRRPPWSAGSATSSPLRSTRSAGPLDRRERRAAALASWRMPGPQAPSGPGKPEHVACTDTAGERRAGACDQALGRPEVRAKSQGIAHCHATPCAPGQPRLPSLRLFLCFR